MVNPLSRVAMGNLLKDKKPIISQRVTKGDPIGSREEEIILDIIHGKRDVSESLGKKEVITLEEAANRIKNNR